jgi:hypothetical protein
MSEQDERPPQPDPLGSPPMSPFDLRRQWGRERREKVVQEILANRRGEYRVPTWVLAVGLAVMIAVVIGVIALA